MKRMIATAALVLTAGTAPLLAQSAPAAATNGFETTMPLQIEGVNERAREILTRIHQQDDTGTAD